MMIIIREIIGTNFGKIYNKLQDDIHMYMADPGSLGTVDHVVELIDLILNFTDADICL